MEKVLLINPCMEELYKKAKVKSSVPVYFPLNLLIIAKPLLEKGYEVKLLDLNINNMNIKETIIKTLDDFKPNYVGITFTTPLYSQSLFIAKIVKQQNSNITIVGGGVHISTDYSNTLKKSDIDIAILGEGDFKLLEIIKERDLEKIKGIAYKKDDQIIVNEKEPLLKDLDDVPFPAVELINIHDYKVPHTFCLKNPVFPLETSRGCVYGCTYCSKCVFGRLFRTKSVERVMQDIRKIVDLGYKEVHLFDDGFTTIIPRAKEICRRIIKEKIPLKFNCTDGIRADRIDLELLKLMKKAGFYQVSFGVETGSEKILKAINKGLHLKDVENAFMLCRKAKIQTLAFFMFGLPEETEEDIKKTIKFAKKLKPDIAKFDIMIPLPGTPVFEEWTKKGYILSYNWDDYGFYKEKPIYKHPNLSWKTLTKYLHLSYKQFYLSPNFLITRFFKSIKQKTLLQDIKLFFKTDW